MVYRKGLSKNNAKSLGTLRQKFKKYTRDFEDDISSYRENPDGMDSEAEDDDDLENIEDEQELSVSAFKKESSFPR